MTPEHLANQRHSLAHLLGAAIMELYPTAKLTLGPSIDDGFYYDAKFDAPVGVDALPALEKKMKELLPTWKTVTHKEVSKDEALAHYKGNEFKTELINEIADRGEPITLYTMGSFVDLCRGGHIDDLSAIDPDSFKLDRVAGAYWRGSEANPMLTRIYGFAFESKATLDEYLQMRIEAEKRDHRKLGKEMSLFAFDDDVGGGLPLWLPNGAAMIEELERLAKESEFEQEYVRVRTPHLAKESMYLTSGHLPYYEDSMYPPMEYEGGKYYLKAMNCPHHHKIFAAEPKSYRDLPLRLAEYGTCYRHEKSGELFGLMRVRALQMNDAHIYCTEEQFAEEFGKVNDLYLRYFKIFGIEKYVMRLSLHDKAHLGKKYVNEPELWGKTEAMVRKVLVDANIPFVEVQNEAAFYGPKIDVQVWSAIGREFTLATNQVDFAVPARFGLTYTDSDGKMKTPLCIHRAPLGTHERFIGFLTEHYGGNFPTWLAPLQVAIIPVKETHVAEAKKLQSLLRGAMIRSELYDDNNSLGKRIHAAKSMHIPYIIVLGDKEIESGTYAVELRDGSKAEMTVDILLERLVSEIKERK
ncbi:MAG: threonine--tRNA ligase [Candidatus Pacebacteria bacterium]|nr:threonine--tRNA ligase [Candidatus Paceibacterota bacterium]MBP9701100.1 threonine--tRNA ligase [Candidatus Paceibacterota bacterium]